MGLFTSITRPRRRHEDVTDWLRRRNLKDGLSNVVIASLLFVVGMALLCWLIPAGWMLGRVIDIVLERLSVHLGENDPNSDRLLPFVLVPALIFLFWGNARWLPQFTGRIPERMPDQLELLSGILFAGPWMINAARLALAKAIRLWRMDLAVCAEILGVLMRTGHRVSFTDLAGQLRGGNAVEALPQLRDLDGIVFLTRDPAGVSLTDEMRRELWDWLPTGEDMADEGPRSARRPKAEPKFRPRIKRPPPPPPIEPERETYPLQLEHEVLGVARGATLADIKKAYRRHLKECHPDRFAALGRELQVLAGERTRKVITAYETLRKAHRENGSSLP